MKLGPGDMYLQLVGVPHSPMREAGSLGWSSNGNGKARPWDKPMWPVTSATTSHDTYFELTNIEDPCLVPCCKAARTCVPVFVRPRDETDLDFTIDGAQSLEASSIQADSVF